MSQEIEKMICVFRSGRLYDFNMAVNALKENHVPFSIGEERAGSLRFAMSYNQYLGLGTWYTLSVPEDQREEADKILNGLQLDSAISPSISYFGAGRNEKMFLIANILIALGALSLFLGLILIAD